MKKIYNKLFILLAIFLGGLVSCKKSDFLNAKPDQSLVVPGSLGDMQALLDNDNIMNGNIQGGVVPALGDIGADGYYVTDAYYIAYLTAPFNKYYTWDANPSPAEREVPDWDLPYQCVFYANVVLDGLSKIARTEGNANSYDNAKGSALFYRAHIFYQLAQIFAPAYDGANAGTLLGIPLRLSSDINEKINRATLQQTYDRVIEDLTAARDLLPDIPQYVTRPSKAAVYGLLARVSQTMENYDLAKTYADSCLSIYHTLINISTLDTNSIAPFLNHNEEIIFKCHSLRNGMRLPTAYNTIDSNFAASFDPNDLRLKVYTYHYPTYLSWRGAYWEGGASFAGIAVDEIYLIRAECDARLGDATGAMQDLNTLLQTRYRDGTYVPFTATDAGDALVKILNERKKELLFHSLRWTDLKRLNKDSRFATALTRVVGGTTYTLPPADERYVYLIPENVIQLNPGMKQNDR